MDLGGRLVGCWGSGGAEEGNPLFGDPCCPFVADGAPFPLLPWPHPWGIFAIPLGWIIISSQVPPLPFPFPLFPNVGEGEKEKKKRASLFLSVPSVSFSLAAVAAAFAAASVSRLYLPPLSSSSLSTAKLALSLFLPLLLPPFLLGGGDNCDAPKALSPPPRPLPPFFSTPIISPSPLLPSAFELPFHARLIESPSFLAMFPGCLGSAPTKWTFFSCAIGGESAHFLDMTRVRLGLSTD